MMNKFGIFYFCGLLSCITSRNVVLNEPSEVGGHILESWLRNGKIGNPEEQGPYIEGDLILAEARNGVTSSDLKWNKGIVPYEIRGSFTQAQKTMMSEAIEDITKKTCIKFVPHGGEKDFLVIENAATGCWSAVGKVGGRQVVNLQNECFGQKGTVIHELCHALGFTHEQNRSDRDKFVRIINANIPADKMINFDKNEKDETFGVQYDYGSVLHYSQTAFSRNGQPTIESKGSPQTKDQMGQRVGLSSSDIKKLNQMYCK